MASDNSYFPIHLKNGGELEPVFARLRDLVRPKGVDPNTAVIADFFPDDTSFYFGILVTPEARVFQFGYDYLHLAETEGKLSEWNELTQSWRTSPYHEEVGAALKFVGAAA